MCTLEKLGGKWTVIAAHSGDYAAPYERGLQCGTCRSWHYTEVWTRDEANRPVEKWTAGTSRLTRAAHSSRTALGVESAGQPDRGEYQLVGRSLRRTDIETVRPWVITQKRRGYRDLSSFRRGDSACG